MFDSLISWFNGWWQVFQEVFQEVWDWGKNSWSWVVALLIGFISLVGDFWDWFAVQINSTVAQVATIVMPQAGSAFSGSLDLLDKANTFFPVSEAFAVMALLVALLIIAVGIRLIRWIKGLIIA